MDDKKQMKIREETNESTEKKMKEKLAKPKLGFLRERKTNQTNQESHEKHIQVATSRNGRGVKTTGVKRIMNMFYGNKFNTEKMHKLLLKNTNLPKLTQDKTENLRSPIALIGIQALLKTPFYKENSWH